MVSEYNFVKENYLKITDVLRAIEYKFTLEPTKTLEQIKDSLTNIEDYKSEIETSINNIEEEINIVNQYFDEFELIASDLEDLTDNYRKYIEQEGKKKNNG